MSHINTNQQRKFYLKTLGCQMNEHDSEVIAGILARLGYVQTEECTEADLILYNTCSVRENPERKVYGQITSLKQLKDKNPGLLIGICGCMPQQKEELEKLLARLPHVDLIFGTHNIHRLPELLERAQTEERVVEVWDDSQEVVEDLPAIRANKFKAFVNVIYGCNNFCSYCVVPYTRGRERSRSPKDILKEVRRLADEGYKEVTLLGQNVNTYGADLDEKTSFAELLSLINDVPGVERIRFTTSHPKDMQDELIEAIANLPKVCEHLHLPVQTGSDRILKLMNRHYTSAYYLDLVAKIREAVPEINLTTDLIVGFPGETEEDFQDTLRLVEAVRFSSAFTFIYSPRPGTPAAKMADQVPEDVKKERVYRLIDLQNRISLEYMQAQLGKTEEVLVDELAAKTGELSGRTRTNKQVLFSGPSDLLGKLVQVKITEAKTWSLRGVMA
ncbi:MAG: tRNA (N6-isopentenyl adenosine(37)-C2)-methylthiotransferase MiaB [Limnochordia bacterium]|jgi:tRNA-2-methylthio-N6-dimethylallyladenosine synthase|nr:tRNA (N6-isopentenyl adenosine(37)-C2)-methylthiotransferase MiaB [Bacillota bacterium]NLH31550.1 tRNA (N6-isopentenyl adenosine(37)-C2)-methylthiotransferase MiaB [Bacillota bacterium]HQD70662.1 tRNA (N6-isopentenyl adenosine(37)-C2)-methylthiotransferase MiaB [Limnochordia bacterium]